MNSRTKYIILLCLAFLLLLPLLVINRGVNYYNAGKYENIKYSIINSNRKNVNFVSSIKLNDSYCFYDSISDSFLFSVSGFDMFKFNVDVISNYDYEIAVNSSSNVIDLKEQDSLELLIYNDDYYYNAFINFTTLPIVGVFSDFEINDYNFLSNTFMLNNFNEKFNSSFESFSSDLSLFVLSDPYFKSGNKKSQDVFSFSDVSFRGHDSLLYDKKSYKLNLKKTNLNTSEKNDISLLGMYNDDDWILDAMYIDRSNIRNKLSSDLWKLITNFNGLNGNYVELFIDNKYNGLYCLKESLNKKSLNISDGSILKAILYTNEFDNNLYYIDDKIFTLKYTSNFDFTKKYLIDRIDKYYQMLNSGLSVDSYIENFFDIDNILNYNVFLSFIKGIDNQEYNNYYYSINESDKKIIKTPWDMDLTFGVTFGSVYEYENYDKIGVNVYYNNSEKINKLINDRYWTLREKYLNMDTVNLLLDYYSEILISSGATERDSNRWYSYDEFEEIENIRLWCKNRIDYLDYYYSQDF